MWWSALRDSKTGDYRRTSGSSCTQYSDHNVKKNIKKNFLKSQRGDAGGTAHRKPLLVLLPEFTENRQLVSGDVASDSETGGFHSTHPNSPRSFNQ